MAVLTATLLFVSFLVCAAAFKCNIFMGSDSLESGFLSAFSSVLTLGLLSWALMHFDRYSATWIICGGFVVAASVAITFHFVKEKQFKIEPPLAITHINSIQTGLLGAVLVGLGSLYALFPTYYLLGGRDPGLYLLFSQHIAETGGLHFAMPAFGEFSSESVRQSYPALYSAAARGLSTDRTLLIPQFLHLFPAIGAIFYSAASLAGLVRANAFIAVLALWGVFVTGKRLMGYWPALAAVIVLGVNPAVIWNARITLTEALSVAILFGGLAFLWRSYDRKDTLWAFFAGAVLGVGLFDRVDAALNALPLLGVAAYAAFSDRTYRRAGLAAVAGYFIFSTIGYLDGFLNSYPYIYDLWSGGSLKALVGFNYATIILSVALLSVPDVVCRRVYFSEKKLLLIVRLGIAALGIWLIVSYFILPGLSNSFPAHASRELGWYISPLAYPLFLGGMYIATHDHRLRFFLPLWIIAGAAMLIFTWRPSISPDLIWATRRWVPYVIPTVMLFSVYCIWRPSTVKFRPALIPILAGAVAGIFLYYVHHSYVVAKPFLFKSMLARYPEQYRSLVNSIKNAHWATVKNNTYKSYGVLFTKNIRIASILTYIYHVPTVLIYGNSRYRELIERWGNLAIVGDTGPFQTVFDSRQLCGQYLEITIGSLPGKVYDRCYDTSIGIVSAFSKAHTASVLNKSFHTQVGVIDERDRVLKSRGAPGYLLYGPYVTLSSGHYKVKWNGNVLKLPKGHELGFVDVSADYGKKIVKTKPLIDDRLAAPLGKFSEQITFTLPKRVENVEFRVYVGAGEKIALKSVSLQKLR
jgi:hypothetical protein